MENIRSSRRSILKVLAVLPFGGMLFGSFLGSTAKADQPHMQVAKDALRTARSELQQATADKGGHRENAIKLIDRAIDEVEAGIHYDRRH